LTGVETFQFALTGSFRLLPTPGTVTRIGDLLLEATGSLDLNAQGLILSEPTPNTLTSLRQAAAELSLMPGNGFQSVGYATASSILGPGGGFFMGATVDPDDLIVRPTQPGDANLDGVVDLIDLSRLAASFGSPGSWDEGDSNHDRLVDLIDLSLLASSFGQPAIEPVASSSDADADFMATPEPTSATRLWQSTRVTPETPTWQNTSWLSVDEEDDGSWFGLWKDQQTTGAAPGS
jgi:hypothetical protein